MPKYFFAEVFGDRNTKAAPDVMALYDIVYDPRPFPQTRIASCATRASPIQPNVPYTLDVSKPATSPTDAPSRVTSRTLVLNRLENAYAQLAHIPTLLPTPHHLSRFTQMTGSNTHHVWHTDPITSILNNWLSNTSPHSSSSAVKYIVSRARNTHYPLQCYSFPS
ncbi:hypothetical protein BOTBODRAFT_287265 [Botryobasidium botryosum FD-172 SS1]|uniref:Uncharacterized protein n=1 Tax=Botryobasidium botryosum (strain FD-172 SS1) TaxID=930990 RepID=A0A067MM06_BOTB1|nr:hypothetical protein BOTBODRAFT_287265 [Botryobasidium botryosum FD-172 SS1]